MMALKIRIHTLLVLSVAVAGCGGPYKEPTIDDFDGKLTHDGEAVTFPAEETVILQLVFHKNGERFGVPIKPDGTFDIGWMPIGKYSATLERHGGGSKSGRGSPPATRHEVKGGLTVAEGQTQYAIDLGDDFKL